MEKYTLDSANIFSKWILYDFLCVIGLHIPLLKTQMCSCMAMVLKKQKLFFSMYN
jgi:hypothetical protein